MSQVEESTGLKLTTERPMLTWAVKHAQWLINRYMIGFGGKTAYNSRWSRDYGGSLRMLGEWIDAELPRSKTVKAPKKEGLNGSLECTLERTLKPMRLSVGR